MDAPSNDRGFRLLAHTADEGFEVWGTRLEALYARAAEALFHLMGEPSALEHEEPFEQVSEGVEREDALVRLLSDLLARFELEGRFVTSAECLAIDLADDGAVGVTLRCSGGRVDRDHEPTLQEVKAVTYHGLFVREDGATLRARVFVDL